MSKELPETEACSGPVWTERSGTPWVLFACEQRARLRAHSYKRGIDEFAVMLSPPVPHYRGTWWRVATRRLWRARLWRTQRVVLPRVEGESAPHGSTGALPCGGLGQLGRCGDVGCVPAVRGEPLLSTPPTASLAPTTVAGRCLSATPYQDASMVEGLVPGRFRSCGWWAVGS